jgi:arginase
LSVKIVRDPTKIALIGAPTSAAALAPGHERAPAALRAAGLVAELKAAGFEVADLGDCPVETFQADEEHPRARNIIPLLATLNALRPLVEQAVKSGALALVLGGDCSIALGTLAGVRRYYPRLSLVYCDRDADLNTPATTQSGCVDGMVVSHVIGRGAPELVRFWREPPLVREPDIALFGIGRLDPGEEQFLATSPIRHYPVDMVQRMGAAAAAEDAQRHIHASSNKQLVIHFDVDAITAEDFAATNFAAPGGLRLDEVQSALEVFAKQANLAAFEVTVYNPERDADGSAAGRIVKLIVAILAARLAALTAPKPEPKAEEPARESSETTLEAHAAEAAAGDSSSNSSS